MADSRTILKEFFETGDVPTQAQFASLIDSLLSIEDDSNLKNNLKIKSATNGKIQLQFNDTFFAISTDGDDFITGFINLTPNEITLSIANGAFRVGMNINEGVVIAGAKISFRSLPTFANNADALTGGLLNSNIYKTATGELRIVV